MANEDYDDRRHMARDVRDAHVSEPAAKTMATLAFIAAVITLAIYDAKCLWLPAHHSISDLSLEYQVDGNYLKDLVQRLRLRLMLA